MSDKGNKLSPNFSKGNFSCNVMNMNMNKTEFKKAHKGHLKTDIDALYDEVIAHKSAYKKQEGITDK